MADAQTASNEASYAPPADGPGGMKPLDTVPASHEIRPKSGLPDRIKRGAIAPANPSKILLCG
jgi:hypothetical protein